MLPPKFFYCRTKFPPILHFPPFFPPKAFFFNFFFHSFHSAPTSQALKSWKPNFHFPSISFFLFFSLTHFHFHHAELSLTSPPRLATTTSLALATTTSLVHLGTKNINFQMGRYVFKGRSDGWFFCLFFTFSLLGFCYCFGLVLIISNSRVNWVSNFAIPM